MIITPRLSTRSFHSNDHCVLVPILVCAYIYLYYIRTCRALFLIGGREGEIRVSFIHGRNYGEIGKSCHSL